MLAIDEADRPQSAKAVREALSVVSASPSETTSSAIKTVGEAEIALSLPHASSAITTDRSRVQLDGPAPSSSPKQRIRWAPALAVVALVAMGIAATALFHQQQQQQEQKRQLHQNYVARLEAAANQKEALEELLGQCGADCPTDIAQEIGRRLETVKEAKRTFQVPPPAPRIRNQRSSK